ncbi:Chromosome partition protein Smc [Streptococcus infantarius subsp. infantarius]|nr:Chromosome partition protein Smc [Streptococcus infantarius subsp. infantarius]MCO4680454.1 Chromosome partition protein Smc [Streptococcus infantarius subsp. infantarius]
MENVRIAIRDSTDSHNVAFFDNISGIRYQSANLQRFLAGSASILTIEYNSKDIDTIRTGCKLAFIYKQRAYWLNIMDLSKKGYKVEITAYSLGLELNQEERGAHKPANAMSFTEYLAYYDPEHALELGVNEVADKRIKLEWTGTDTILARLFSIANSFDAELEFTVELNQDYSLKRQVLNVYKKGNLGSNRAVSPVRVGRGLKVINYSDNLKELRTAVRATGKDGLTLDGLNKKVYDDDGNLLYYSNANTVYAPQSRDKYPSVGKKSNDNWIIKELGETEYSTQEDLWGYMLRELKKICVPEITYDIEGAVDGDVGDTRTLIDDVHYDPPLYVQARISELTEDLITGKVTKSTLTNFERKYSQVASELLKQVEQLANDAAPYIIRLETNNGFNFKNGKGSSTVTASLEKYGKIVGASWQWIINNSVVSDKQSATINASQVTGTLNVVAVASVDGNEVAREYITFTNSDDGVGIKSIKRYYTTNDQAEGVTAGGQNWSTKPTTVTADKNYMWSYDVITYTNDTSLVTEPAVIGARGDDGLDADTTGITEALDKAKQELTALSANIEKVRDDSLAAVEEAKQQLAAVANDLSKAKTDLQNAVSAVDTKATNLQSDLTTAKQDLQAQASQLTEQASAQSELTKRVSSVEETANGTKTTVSELSKTVDSNTKNITSVTARTKVVEDDLTSTKTTLSQVQTTANSASQKTATLETGLNGLGAKFENLQIGTVNLLHNSKGPFKPNANKVDNWQRFEDTYVYLENGKQYVLSGETDGNFTSIHDSFKESDNVVLWLVNPNTSFNKIMSDGKTGTTGTVFTWNSASGTYQLRVNTYRTVSTKSAWNIQIEEGNLRSTYSQNESDIESKVAEYKQTADQNYASLSSTVQTLDGQVQSNKTTAEQTAQGFSTRIESLETYKDGETTRANQYFELAKTETARQLTAERTAIAKDYVAKSTYTSDVTGIRNDLTATTTTANTTKTNLANYQASNDKAVANLQSNLQTANGNISSLQTKVEAVPGQITSAVSSVEGKIPTSAGGRNLALGTSYDWSYGWTNFNGQTNQTNILYRIYNRGFKIGDKINVRIVLKCSNIVAAEGQTASGIAQCAGNVTNWGRGQLDSGSSFNFDGSSGEIELKGTTVVDEYTLENEYWNWHLRVDYVTSGKIQWKEAKAEVGDLPTPWSPAPEDYDSKLATAQSEIKQTTDSITASVSSVQTAASNAQSTANTAVSKADAAQAGVNTLDNTTVKTATLNLDNNGFVTKVGKTVNGNTFATMIAQNESDVQIIAKKMKVSGDMIVNGAITAEKLNVSNLSAVNSNLGKIEGGSLLLQENKAASSSIDSWGTFNRPAHKQGLYMDNHGLASSGAIQRKNSGETMPTDMPLAVLQSGELRFLVVDYNDNLENVLHYGLSDPDFGAIRFEIDSELKRRLTMMSSGYLNFQATNYTNWTSTGVNGCEYMIQGRLVLVNYDVTFNSAGTHTIGGIPQEFTKKSLMMTAKAWTITPRDKNIQLNSDGTLHILDAEANVNYRGTLVFSY